MFYILPAKIQTRKLTNLFKGLLMRQIQQKINPKMMNSQKVAKNFSM
jgi:hypothetical protein